MTVVKMKMLRLPRLNERNRALEMSIMVTGDQDQLAKPAQLFDQPLGRRLRRAIMHEISQNNEPIRPVVAQQLLQAYR